MGGGCYKSSREGRDLLKKASCERYHLNSELNRSDCMIELLTWESTWDRENGRNKRIELIKTGKRKKNPYWLTLVVPVGKSFLKNF